MRAETQLTALVLLTYASAVLIGHGSASSGNVPRPRGVSLTKTALYQPQADSSWTCLDGSKKIPFVQINDNYCDCVDGSDEPGTPACSNGQFHCNNLGHKPLEIPSSRVDDGICDCCDGSDEENSRCINTCIELGAAEALKLKSQAELHKRGAEKRQEMITRGRQLKSDRQARRAELDRRIKEQEALKAEKEELKRNAEALETEAVEAFKEQQRELDADTAQAEEEPLQMRQEASLSFVRYDTNKDGFVEVTELMVDMNLDRDRNGVVEVEEAKYFLDERDRVDLDAFVTLAWPRIKPLKMLAEGLFKPPQIPEAHHDENLPATEDVSTQDPLPSEDAEIEPASEDERADDEEIEDDHYDDEEPDVGVGEATPETTTPPNYDPETQRLIEQANAARIAFDEVERQIREIEHEIKEIDEQTNKDYGAHEEWAVLDGECYNFEDREYVYNLCPFDRAAQKPRNGGSETTLGRWDQWIGEGNNKYTKQKYAHGAACWNGPQRSAIIHISCALEPRITAVSEPNRCEYYYEFETPAACDSEAFAANAENLHDEL
ncbi:glucosidase 2 subunit beta [Scaptodrosophila lebanonensis]|uniref:Glucosidase 2 subunit beta n=1 Tax=Drosophila lebanonensis TaxID=7225 RepID=A0A6J2U386_DROLE|nr:glucosidase 2 subunit beta [Scaptodrosophila lebanonensis]